MRTQRGAVLMVSLVFLLLLTLLATSSMQNATLQEKMAGSQARRDASFQAAESALRMGEAEVRRVGLSIPLCTGPAACLPPEEALTRSVAGTGGASGVMWVTSAAGLFGIQFLGETAGDADGGTSGPSATRLYRVTAIGMQGTARTVLESVLTDESRVMWRQRL